MWKYSIPVWPASHSVSHSTPMSFCGGLADRHFWSAITARGWWSARCSLRSAINFSASALGTRPSATIACSTSERVRRWSCRASAAVCMAAIYQRTLLNSESSRHHQVPARGRRQRWTFHAEARARRQAEGRGRCGNDEVRQWQRRQRVRSAREHDAEDRAQEILEIRLSGGAERAGRRDVELVHRAASEADRAPV